jgi:hypothetical protein
MFDNGAPVSGCTTFGLIQVSAKKPRTTLGIEARTSSAGLRTRRLRGPAYSDEPERRRDQHRDHRDDQRAGRDRGDVVHAAPREPAIGDERRWVDVGEEMKGIAEQRQNDRAADPNGQPGGAEERGSDELLPASPVRGDPQIGGDEARDQRPSHAARVSASASASRAT